MIPSHHPLPSEPAEVGRLVETMFRVFTATLRACFPLMLAPSLLGVLPLLTMPNPELDPFGALTWFQRPSVWIMYLTIILASALCINAAVFRMAMLGRGHDADLAKSLARGLQRLPASLVGWLLYTLLTLATLLPWIGAMLAGFAVDPQFGGAVGALLGSWTLALPTWACVAFGFFLFAIVLERAGPLASFRRSMHLVRGSWWRTSLVVGLALLVYSLGMFFVTLMAFAVAALVVWAAPGTSVINAAYLLIGVQLLMAPFAAMGQQLVVASGLAMFNDLVLRRPASA